jgi:hypothetical protein
MLTCYDIASPFSAGLSLLVRDGQGSSQPERLLKVPEALNVKRRHVLAT